MKALKRAFALLMVLTMVMAMGTGMSNAAGNGVITVEDADSGNSYVAYRIFDLVKNGTSYSYTIDGESGDTSATITKSEWWDSVLSYMGNPSPSYEDPNDTTSRRTYTGKGITLSESALDRGRYTVTVNLDSTGGATVFSAPDFATFLRGVIDNPPTGVTFTGTTLTYDANTKKATASNLDLGYWFVTSPVGAVCNLTTTDPTTTIHDKNIVEFNKVEDVITDGTSGKYDDEQNPLPNPVYPTTEVGKTVKYTLSTKVPDKTGREYFIYKFKDIMSKGITYTKQSVKVYVTPVGGTRTQVTVPNYDATKTEATLMGTSYCPCSYSTDPTEPHALYDLSDKNGFILYINLMNFNYNDLIEVEYEGVVNSDGVCQISINDSYLYYQSDPSKDSCSKPKKDDEKLYVAAIKVIKVDGQNKQKTLDGAKFVLYKEVQGTKYYYKWTDPTTTGGKDAKVEWVDITALASGAGKTLAQAITDGDITQGVTANGGICEAFKGLQGADKSGNPIDYYLHETEAPTGYNLMTTDSKVQLKYWDKTNNKIDPNMIDPNDVTGLTLKPVEATVENNSGSKLPETGGIGTTIFYIVGGILVFGAVVLLVSKKIFNTQENN